MKTVEVTVTIQMDVNSAGSEVVSEVQNILDAMNVKIKDLEGSPQIFVNSVDNDDITSDDNSDEDDDDE